MRGWREIVICEGKNERKKEEEKTKVKQGYLGEGEVYRVDG